MLSLRSELPQSYQVRQYLHRFDVLCVIFSCRQRFLSRMMEAIRACHYHQYELIVVCAGGFRWHDVVLDEHAHRCAQRWYPWSALTLSNFADSNDLFEKLESQQSRSHLLKLSSVTCFEEVGHFLNLNWAKQIHGCSLRYPMLRDISYFYHQQLDCCSLVEERSLLYHLQIPIQL